MRQEKIKSKVRERKRVKEHSMKREEEGGGGDGHYKRPIFLPPEEKGASSCRSIVLGFESAKKDEFVSYSIDKR